MTRLRDAMGSGKWNALQSAVRRDTMKRGTIDQTLAFGARKKEFEAVTRGVDIEAGIVDHFGSTGNLDRDSEVVAPGSFERDLEAFRKNPVALWAHDHSEPPIGRVLEVSDLPEGLAMRTKFAREVSDFATMIFNLYAEGYLSAWSIGFIPKEFSADPIAEGQKGVTYTRVELYEVSAVPVPSNRESLGRLYKTIVAQKQLAGGVPIIGDGEEREGRVLSRKNRKIIVTAKDAMKNAVGALNEVLAADRRGSEEEEDEGKDHKNARVERDADLILKDIRRAAPELTTALRKVRGHLRG